MIPLDYESKDLLYFKKNTWMISASSLFLSPHNANQIGATQVLRNSVLFPRLAIYHYSIEIELL